MIKNVLFILIVLLIQSFQSLNGQVINKEICEQFLATKELYLLKSNINSAEFTTSKGAKLSFQMLVSENWPDKKIIEIEEKDYNKSEGVKNKFHICLINFSTVRYKQNPANDVYSSMDGILIRQGKTKDHPVTSLYWVKLNLREISKDIFAERMEYAVQNLKSMLENHNDKSVRNSYIYKTENFHSVLDSHTLYIKKSTLRISNEEVKKVYNKRFKIVEDDAWIAAIQEEKDDVLFVEHINGDRYSAIDVYKAKGGKMIYSSYPWIGSPYLIDKVFFGKLQK